MKLSKHHINLLATYTAEKGADMLYDEQITHEMKTEWDTFVGGKTTGEVMSERAYENIADAVYEALDGLEVC